MANFLLKKSYQLKDLKETNYKHLWGDHGIFTTMWVFGKPVKVLFLESHIQNLIKSLKIYGISTKTLKKEIFKLISKNFLINKKYDHLLRIAVNKKIISISLRRRVIPKKNFNLKLVKLKREKPQYKNLRYKKILSYLSKMDNSKSDIALIHNKKILETGTSNLLFIKNQKVFAPKKYYYEGNTFKFFKNKIKGIIKKDIYLDDLKEYDEIILIGSGKGVTSVKTIKEINWKRKNLKKFNVFLKLYKSAIKNCNNYKF